MSKPKRIGTCHLCGAVGDLSFEHVPPRAAFNEFPAVVYKAEQVFDLGPDEKPRTAGKISQRGVGGYTLCGRCNNNTGSWYGTQFASWCHQGMQTLANADGNPTLVYLHYLYPLAIIKQVATMFFSINGDKFHSKNAELAAFVLERERKGLSNRYRFFMYYSGHGRLRSSGVAARLHLGSDRMDLMSEMTFPPFGYVMTFGGPPPDRRLFEISHFARFGYYELATTEIRMPVLETHLAFPGDYRTREEIARDVALNEAAERGDV